MQCTAACAHAVDGHESSESVHTSLCHTMSDESKQPNTHSNLKPNLAYENGECSLDIVAEEKTEGV